MSSFVKFSTKLEIMPLYQWQGIVNTPNELTPNALSHSAYSRDHDEITLGVTPSLSPFAALVPWLFRSYVAPVLRLSYFKAHFNDIVPYFLYWTTESGVLI